MGAHVEGLRPELAALAHDLVGDDPFERAAEGTRFAQPAIFCASLAGWDLVNPDAPQALAGHSLGEFAALVAAGSLDAEDGLRLVVARARLMQAAADAAGGGGMLAVLGEDRRAIDDVGGRLGLSVANDNAPAQVVLSGPNALLEIAARELKERGMRVRLLPVDGPFHSAAMAPAVPAFRKLLREIEIRPPQVPVFSCVTAEPFDYIAWRLAQGITAPVRWLDVLRRLQIIGVRRFIETGPGRVLTGLVRSSLTDVDVEVLEPQEVAGV